MKTAKRNEAKGMVARAGTAAILGMTLWMVAGCSVIESIDRKLAAWGIVDATISSEIDPLAVVAIQTWNSRGTGVILENGLVFTACHVMEGQETAVVRTCGYYRDSYYQVLSARVVYRNPATDQALLAVEDADSLRHTAKLAAAAPGSALVTPMRPCGDSSMGDVVCRPVVRPVEIGSSGKRFGGNARLARGDSGCPIVQDGAVVGLVRGEGSMVSSDVLANYWASRAPGRKAAEKAAPDGGSSADGAKTPQLSAKVDGPARS